MARRGHAEVEGSPRHGRGPQPAAGQPRPARTTTPHREPATQSRRARRPPPGSQVAPLIRLLSRVFVIGGVTTVDLGGSVASEKRGEGLIDQSSIRDSRPRTAGTAEKFRIDRRTETYAIHATSMPLNPGIPAAANLACVSGLR